MTVFYVLGALAAVWAVVLAALGLTRPGFPATPRSMRAVMGISAVVVAGAVLSAVIGASLEEGEGEAHGPGEAEAAESEPEGGESGAAELPADAQELRLTAVPSGALAFDPEALQAQPGTVALVMANPSPIPHNVSIEGGGVSEEGETVETGGTSTVSAEVEAGRYTYYCSVPGHREGGMVGTLTVGGQAPQGSEAPQGGQAPQGGG